jgi:hypothetical protein
MVQKTTSPPTAPARQADALNTWPAEVAALLHEVRKLLDVGNTAEALERIGRSKLSSPWLLNAAAVCQLRLGNTRFAVDALRGLVIANGLFLRGDVPTVFKVNFAAALIADDNLSGGLRALGELGDDPHPAAQEARESVRRWEASMTFWQSVWWWVAGTPPWPLMLSFPPGRLE